MNYVIKNRASNKIRQFYRNVAKKYRHTYSIEQMLANIDLAIDGIFQIENGLQRRTPTISRWDGLYMATSKDRKWNYAYKISKETIYGVDACHSQNMHENVLRLSEHQFKHMIVECVTKILKGIA